MNWLLKTETFLKNNLTADEVLCLISLLTKSDMEGAKKSLVDKGFITQDGDLFGGYRITRAGADAMNNIIIDSDDKVPKVTDKDLEVLAGEMRAIYPKGYQQEYPVKMYPWRCSIGEVKDRLRKFWFKFGSEYTNEEILEATKRYVERMSGQRFMQTLKYFIWKKNDADGSYGSALANEIDAMREGEEETKPTSDWQNKMV